MFSPFPSMQPCRQPFPYSTTACHTGITQGLHLPNSRVSMGDRQGKEKIQRQLLPSMHEALGEDETLAYLGPALRFRRQAAPTAFSLHWTGRPKSECAPQHPDSSSHVLATGSPPPIPQLQTETSRTERASTNTNALQKASPKSFNAGNSPSNASISLDLGLLHHDIHVFSDPKSTSKVTSHPNRPPATHIQNESVAVPSPVY